MKILFVMRHSGYVRNFESTLRMLCDRGHKVHLAFQIGDTHWLLDPGDVTRQLSDHYRRFSRGPIPAREDGWGFVARELRLSLDYLRYLAPEYHDAPKLRERAMRLVSESFLRRTQQGPFSTGVGRRLVAGWLRALHHAIPCDPRIDAFLEANRPDVLVVTPLIEPGAPQAEYIRSARALGIRSALCVASWDNLTNKGLIHGPPDLVTVWNEMMKREAVDLHDVPPECVAVTGAQPFDHWFDWQPSTTREAFCSRVGLRADQPYVLYLCSSKFIAPVEVPFVRTWVQQMRQSGSSALQQAGVLVRPHPQNADQWRDADLGDGGSVAVWPPAGAAPADAKSRADYFDSIYHSAAVVGINTTAEIESAIVGRGVYTLLAPEFRDTQQGTLHFEHLRQVSGGLLHLAQSFAEHLEQLDAAIRAPRSDDGRGRRFVEAFVRPYGIDVPATPKLVDALESLAQRPAPQHARAPLWASLARPMLARRGERMQREALLIAESKAAAKARKKKKVAALAPFAIDWIHRWVRPGDVLYDIGASAGAYALVAAQNPGGSARVFAFESSYANVASLCTNIVLNSAADQITPIPFALAKAAGPTASLTFPLDELVERLGLPLPNHITLHVDGGELGVLEGAARALASPALRSMLVEVRTSVSEEITDVLAKQGLTLETKVNVEDKASDRLTWYGLFTRGPHADSTTAERQVHYVSR